MSYQEIGGEGGLDVMSMPSLLYMTPICPICHIVILSYCLMTILIIVVIVNIKGPPEYCQDGTVTHLNYNWRLYNTIGDYRLQYNYNRPL